MKKKPDLLRAASEAITCLSRTHWSEGYPYVGEAAKFLVPAIKAEKARREVLKSYLRKLMSDMHDEAKMPTEDEFKVLWEMAGLPDLEKLQAKKKRRKNG